MSNYIYNSFNILCIVYALLGNNLRLLANKNADVIFNTLNAICLAFFFLDFVIMLISDFEYIISFYFWTDIFLMSYLIIDFSGIRESIFGDSEGSKQDAVSAFMLLEVL